MESTAGKPTASTGRDARSAARWVFLIAVLTFCAGLLFGYDQGVIAGALEGIANSFSVGRVAQEVITSWVTLGALVAALAAGSLADRFGRRPVLFMAGVLFIAGAVVQGVAPDVPVLVAGRVVTGFGIGFASTIAPLYAAEMSSKDRRGRMVSTYQLAITVGIFCAYLVADALHASHWRTMFLVAAVPGVLLILGVLVVPESARWLAKVGRHSEAVASLDRITAKDHLEQQVAAVEEEVEREQAQGEAGWGEVFGPRMRRALVVGVGLSVFQQITGINAIIYYANTIFSHAGLVSSHAQKAATLYCVGLVNVLATFIAVAYVDRFGRKPLLQLGLVGMFVSLCAVGLGFAIESTRDTGPGASVVGIITMVSLVVFIASFAMSLGPVVWTVISEIFPSRVRGRAVSVATAANWGAAFLVTQFFLSIVHGIGESATFFLLAAMCVLGYAFVWRFVPETKGRSLEEIQEEWAKGGSPASWEAAG